LGLKSGKNAVPTLNSAEKHE